MAVSNHNYEGLFGEWGVTVPETGAEDPHNAIESDMSSQFSARIRLKHVFKLNLSSLVSFRIHESKSNLLARSKAPRRPLGSQRPKIPLNPPQNALKTKMSVYS